MGMFSKSCISVLESRSQSGHKYVSDMDPLRVCHSAPEKVWAVQIDGWWSLPLLEVYPCIPGWIWCFLMKRWGIWSGNGSWLCQMPVFSHLRSRVSAWLWHEQHSLGSCFEGNVCVVPPRYWNELISDISLDKWSLVLLLFGTWSLAFVFCKSRVFILSCVLECLVPGPQSRGSALEFPFLWIQGTRECCFGSVVVSSSNEQLSCPCSVSEGLGGFHMGTRMKAFSAVTLHKSCKLLRAKG